MNKKILSFIIIYIFLILICNIANGKYEMKNEFEFADIKIYRARPQIDITEIKNSNASNKNLAGKLDTISIKFKITDENIDKININTKFLYYKIDNQEFEITDKNITKISEDKNERIYKITLESLEKDGELKMYFKEGFATNVNGLSNKDIEKDTNIKIYNIDPNAKITYATHISTIGWTYGFQNYDIAGKDSIDNKNDNKIEGIAFNVEGNIPDDFVQVNTYIYTYWGEGSYAKCDVTGSIYKYGYNPDKDKFKSMASDDLVTMNGKKYFQFGGGGINGLGVTDINGNNPIPDELYTKYLFGICGINIKLKDYTYYSIIYQIFVKNVGWITPCSDGQECMYSKTSPITAFRMALVPKNEKQSVLNNWK